MYHVAAALKKGMSVEKIYKLSAIDPWFIEKIKNIIDIEKKLTDSALESGLLREAKKFGFSDKQIGRAIKKKKLKLEKFENQKESYLL